MYSDQADDECGSSGVFEPSVTVVVLESCFRFYKYLLIFIFLSL